MPNDGTTISSAAFTARERVKVRGCVKTVDGWLATHAKWRWLAGQVKIWVKWGGIAAAVVAFFGHYWPTFVEIISIIWKATQQP